MPTSRDKPLRAAVAGNQSELHLGLAELGIVARQTHGAGHRQLAAAAECEAVDAGNHRLAKIFDGIHDGLPAMGVLLGRHRRLLRQLANVGARDECLLARAGQDGNADLGVIFNGREGVFELLHGGHVQRVEHLRPVNGDVGNLVLLFELDVLEVGHG